MKQLTTLLVSGLFFFGLLSCEKVKKDDGTKGKQDSVTTQEGHDHEGETSNLPLSTVQWAETNHDFGKIGPNDSVAYVYKFTNTGSNPVVISEVKPACGCTKGNYSTEPIAPGAEGMVELKFSPHGKTGLQSKSATVVMNTDPKTTTLTFKADIQSK